MEHLEERALIDASVQETQNLLVMILVLSSWGALLFAGRLFLVY